MCYRVIKSIPLLIQFYKSVLIVIKAIRAELEQCICNFIELNLKFNKISIKSNEVSLDFPKTGNI